MICGKYICMGLWLKINIKTKTCYGFPKVKR